MLDFLIHSPVRHFARHTPDHPAMRFDGRSLTYAELRRESHQLAHALLERGLEKGDRVGIFMHKGLPLGPAIYGTLAAGGVFVPLDPFLPVHGLEFILSDCGIRHLISTDRMAKVLSQLGPEHRPTVYGVGVETPLPSVSPEQIRGQPETAPDVWIIDRDLGYIMYTSGSTGNPKGMMHTHRGSISYARWGARHVGLGAADRVASHAPLHFDLSIFDFFSTAQAGGTVVLVPEAVTKFPATWTKLLESECVNVVFTVPFTLIEMLERGVMEQRDLSALRWVLYGGEPFPPKHLREIMHALPRTRFTNVYGPAEAPSCTCYDLPGPPTDDDAAIPIGTVSENSEDRILDEDDQDCPVGEAGELCIRSSTLTRGYWNRPDLNARVFLLEDSLGPFPEVYFRTGDLVMRDAAGLLHFLGRKDRMVKVRGHRIELDGVEAALVSHPAVEEAAAVVVPDDRGSRRLLAAATLLEQSTLEPDELLRHARTRLPPYAVPEELRVVFDLPRTGSGKIDRNQLARDLEGDDQP